MSPNLADILIAFWEMVAEASDLESKTNIHPSGTIELRVSKESGNYAYVIDLELDPIDQNLKEYQVTKFYVHHHGTDKPFEILPGGFVLGHFGKTEPSGRGEKNTWRIDKSRFLESLMYEFARLSRLANCEPFFTALLK